MYKASVPQSAGQEIYWQVFKVANNVLRQSYPNTSVCAYCIPVIIICCYFFCCSSRHLQVHMVQILIEGKLKVLGMCCHLHYLELAQGISII